jgi:prophage DNA circulation protein
MGRSLDANTEIIQDTGREVMELQRGTENIKDDVKFVFDAVENLASKVYRIEGNQVQNFTAVVGNYSSLGIC